jgi:predicted ribosomally synthesized peptide with nif11-like leader
MSVAEVVAFWRSEDNNDKLREDLAQQPEEARAERLAQLASEHGHRCSAEDVVTVQSVLRFWEMAHRDGDLRRRLEGVEKLPSAEDATAEVVSIASAKGFSFGAEDLGLVTSALIGGRGSQDVSDELSDDDLDNVAGGIQQVNQVFQVFQVFDTPSVGGDFPLNPDVIFP